MNVQLAQQIKRSLETFFYKVRFNIGLHNVITSSEYKSFRENVETSLNNQILYYAKAEKVNDIIGLAKATRDLDDKILLQNLEKIWLPLLDIIENDEVKNYYKWVADRGGQLAVNRLKSSETFQLTNKQILKGLNNRIEDFYTNLDSTTKSWIARTIEEGVIAGEGIIDIAKSIRDKSMRAAKVRADRIAEHETAMILGDMTVEVFNRSGVEFHKWVTSRDERVCAICSSNERAGEIRMGMDFPSGNESTPAHVGCRCFTLPITSSAEVEIWMGE